MFHSKTSNLLFTDVLHTRVNEPQTFRDLRTSRYSSIEDQLKRVEKTSKPEKQKLKPLILPQNVKSGLLSRELTSRRSEQKTRATSIKLTKQIAIQSPDEKKETLIKLKGIERHQLQMIEQLKYNLLEKTQVEAEKLIELKEKVKNQEENLKKILSDRLNFDEEEINSKIKHLIQVSQEETMGLKRKVQSDEQITKKLLQNLPSYRKGSYFDPTKYQQLYDTIYNEKVQKISIQKVNRILEKAKNKKFPFNTEQFHKFIQQHGGRIPNFIKPQ